jgi:hypothetical protein
MQFLIKKKESLCKQNIFLMKKKTTTSRTNKTNMSESILIDSDIKYSTNKNNFTQNFHFPPLGSTSQSNEMNICDQYYLFKSTFVVHLFLNNTKQNKKTDTNID